MDNKNPEFVKKLLKGEYGDLFAYPAHDQTIEKIWAESEEGALLDAILNDAKSDKKAQFLACVVFFKKDIFFMQRHPPQKVAEIYAHALANDYTGMANSWGLLYKHEDDGQVGIAFITIGEKAIPALFALLDNESTHLSYHGSIEATLGNQYNFRVKDFAAYYLGRIIGEPLQYYASPKERDEQIETLRKKIQSRK